MRDKTGASERYEFPAGQLGTEEIDHDGVQQLLSQYKRARQYARR